MHCYFCSSDSAGDADVCESCGRDQVASDQYKSEQQEAVQGEALHKKITLEGVDYWLVPVAMPSGPTTWAACGLEPRYANSLIIASVVHLEQVLEMSEADLLRLSGVGRKTLNTVREILAKRYPLYRIGQNK